MGSFLGPSFQIFVSRVLQLLTFRVYLTPSQRGAKRQAGPRSCKRFDGRQLVGKTTIKFNEPTIITNILDDLFPAAGAAWEEAKLKRRLAKETVTCRQVGGSGCSDYNGTYVIPFDKPIKLAKLMKRWEPNGITGDLPGNLFIKEKHPVVKRLVASVVNDSSNVPILSKALESLRHPRQLAVSLGREAQWNNLHRHDENLFLQMSGRKGWVIFKKVPKKLIKFREPDLIDEEKQFGIFDQLSICRYVMSCERWADLTFEDRSTLCRRTAIEEETRNNAVSRYKGFTCEVKQGEALYIPLRWWHGTCNLDAWNAGFTYITHTETWQNELEEEL